MNGHEKMEMLRNVIKSMGMMNQNITLAHRSIHSISVISNSDRHSSHTWIIFKVSIHRSSCWWDFFCCWCISILHCGLVMVLAGMELVFYLGVDIMLHFGFGMRIMLMFQLFLSSAYSKSAPHTTPLVRRVEMHKEWGRDTAKDSWLQLMKGISHCLWCHT